MSPSEKNTSARESMIQGFRSGEMSNPIAPPHHDELCKQPIPAASHACCGRRHKSLRRASAGIGCLGRWPQGRWAGQADSTATRFWQSSRLSHSHPLHRPKG